MGIRKGVLREARQSKGLSQEQLAEAAGLDRSFISLIERGIQTPNIVVLLKISEVLAVSAGAMIGKVEQMLRASAHLLETANTALPPRKGPPMTRLKSRNPGRQARSASARQWLP